eukprot:5075881-Amphidinium_carterae.1
MKLSPWQPRPNEPRPSNNLLLRSFSTALSATSEWISLCLRSPLSKRISLSMRTLAAKSDHPSRAVLNAACGGLWMNDRRARAFDEDPECVFCHTGFGTPQHVVFECPAFAQQRREAH